MATTSYSAPSDWFDAHHSQQRATLYWRLWFATILGITGITAYFMLAIMPVPLPIGGIIFFGTVALFWHQPRYGLYMIVTLALVGDATLLPWYPFVKNFSSAESLLYLHSAIIFSPLELYMVLILTLWLGKGAMARRLIWHTGELFWPTIGFTLFLVLGLIYGLATGGNANIALWEVRPIFYIPVLLILTTNFLNTYQDVNRLIWLIMIALFIEGLVGSYHYFVVLGMNIASVQRITEHSAAIHMNTFFVLILATWLYQGSTWKRVVLPMLAPAVLLTYIATQRRAAFLSLGIALILLAILLYQQNRKRFWQIVPIVALVAAAYIGAFWHSNGALGLPAQAVKSIIAPQENSADTLSNLYRMIENVNINHTIRLSPLTGVGFGNKFHIIVQMPDISFFVWWEYIVHNSIFWIWMKTGVLGFMSMLFLVSYSILTGARLVAQMPNGDLRAITLTATLYIVMHFLYAYVDMSWDNQSMIYVGTMLGIINSAERIKAQSRTQPVKQRPWELHSASRSLAVSGFNKGSI